VTETFRPDSEAALRDAIAEARDGEKRLEVRGQGTKRGYGRPVATDAVLSLDGLSGITYFDAGELVMEAQAGTPLAEIEVALEDANQRLAFEPGDLGALYGAPGGGTIGGVFACNVSGPRRPFAGAARDHLLGLRAVSGRGEVFAAGGRVVKNVTGYDMGKLLAGSLGTLAVLSTVTFKVLPRPEAERTILLFGEAAHEGLGALQLAAAGPWDISAGAHVDGAAAARSSVSYVAGASTPVTAVRLEGARGAVAERCEALRRSLAGIAPTEELHTHNSRTFWRELRDGALLPAEEGGNAMLWRLTVPPADSAMMLDRLSRVCAGDVLFDWIGGLAWFAIRSKGSAPGETLAARIHRAAAEGGGQAVLMRGADSLRARVAVFGEPAPALLGLTRRLKENFDPRGILNPGRMFEGL
jgi:glycolate oxidase FAD binding subunit